MTSALYSSVSTKVIIAIQNAAFLKTICIAEETRFDEDLGLDSIDLTEVLFHIEEVFNIEFMPEAITGFRRVGDVASYLSQRFFRDVESEPFETLEALAA